jgi:hypothetical protein
MIGAGVTDMIAEAIVARGNYRTRDLKIDSPHLP